jgi:hypothetical protein
MRTFLSILSPALPGLLLVCLAHVAHAVETNKPIQRVLFQESKVIAVQDGKFLLATNDFGLGKDIAVMTNGTFVVRQGKARPFREGDALGADGMLTGADGSVVPVTDHIVLKLGRPMLVVDGEASPLTREYVLGDGTRIQPDATVIAPSGQRSRLLDGQLLKLDGSTLPSKDTVLLQNGKVNLHKDGSPLTLRPDQTITMSDGTKVFGNGTMIKPDGTRVTLTEGEIVHIEGVAPRKR